MTSTNPAQFEFTYEYDSEAETDTWYTVDNLLYQGAAKVTDRRRDQVFTKVEDAGITGLTVWELRQDIPTLHHGMASGALSVLHKAGKIVRTTDKRGGYSVYVTPDNVAGRATLLQGRRPKPCPNCGC